MNTVFGIKLNLIINDRGSYKTSCIYYLISKYIPNKSFIFVTRFPPISVMELVESGFIS